MLKPVKDPFGVLKGKKEYTVWTKLADGRPIAWFTKRKPDLTMKHLVEIDEEQRQLIMLALAKLSNERPGWDVAGESNLTSAN